jgi:hypothetical protein
MHTSSELREKMCDKETLHHKNEVWDKFCLNCTTIQVYNNDVFSARDVFDIHIHTGACEWTLNASVSFKTRMLKLLD